MIECIAGNKEVLGQNTGAVNSAVVKEKCE